MREKREILQRKIYDENGKLQYTIIPNYKKTDYFMSKDEIRFYKVLILIVNEIKKMYNINLQIFSQVAINRIIKQNNQREKELEKDIFCRSLDFVLYDLNKDEIFCCIELDGIEHKNNIEKIEKDRILDNALKNIYKLIRINVSEKYEITEIINKIIK